MEKFSKKENKLCDDVIMKCYDDETVESVPYIVTIDLFQDC